MFATSRIKTIHLKTLSLKICTLAKCAIPFLFIQIIYFQFKCINSQAQETIPYKDTSSKNFDLTDFPVIYPESIQKNETLSNAIRRDSQLELFECGQTPEYLDSMAHLEDSVATQAALSSRSLKTMKDLNTAFLKWIVQFAEIKALELNSSSKNNKTSVEAETDKLLVRYFGKCDQTLPGCVGKDPEVIRQAFKDGNLREQFYLSWNPAIRFLIDHFDEQNACLSSSFTNRELRSLAKRKPVAKRIIQYCDELNYGKDPLDRGRFARANKYFKKHRKTEKYTKDIGSSLIPLSEREKNGPSSDPANWTRGFSFQQAVPKNELDLTQPGFPDPMNLYYHTAKKFGFRTEVAMSGSTDAILNLASILGIQNKDRDLLIASAGYMITHKHHTIYEVLIGARSFGDVKDIPLNSDYYKYMSPDPKFAEKVEKIYKAQGFAQLPTEIYEKCLKEKLAQNRNLPTPSNNCTKPNEPDTILYLKNGLKSVLRFQR